jgi:hypothetical protein
MSIFRDIIRCPFSSPNIDRRRPCMSDRDDGSFIAIIIVKTEAPLYLLYAVPESPIYPLLEAEA